MVIGYKKIEFNSIKNLELKSPITLWVYSNGKKSYAEYPSLNIYSVGSNVEEVVEDFKNDFNFIYNSCALEKDELLTNDAIELKNKLLKIVA